MNVQRTFSLIFTESAGQGGQVKRVQQLVFWIKVRVVSSSQYNWSRSSRTADILLVSSLRTWPVWMIFIEGKEYHPKWGYHLPKGNFIFYFRKDASKFLNQILKQQQKGNSKAGLGMTLNV